MSKQTPHELYGDFTKKDEKDVRAYFSYVPHYELEKAITGVKIFFSNENR